MYIHSEHQRTFNSIIAIRKQHFDLLQLISLVMAPRADSHAIPGTFTLVDVDGVLAARHLDRGDRDIVLVPEPSNDPDDSLNWSPRRKLLSTICVSV